MFLNFEERHSDSPFIERIWRTHSERGGEFTSLALSHWQMCVWEGPDGKVNLTVRGPETQATRVPVPAHTEFLGIIFKLGTFMPHLPAASLVNDATNLPDANDRAVWLQGAAWQLPSYENADTFVDRLAREGMLVREPVVAAALQAKQHDVSLRSVQRRFSKATGLTHGAVAQIERARYALTLLKQGVSILDTVEQAGYSDQPHLTRSLKLYAGHTPAHISANPDEQVSFLFKTAFSG